MINDDQIQGKRNGIGAAVAHFRAERGWSAAKLADAINQIPGRSTDLGHTSKLYSEEDIYKLERGGFKTERKIREFLRFVSKALDLREEDFIDFDPETTVIGSRIYRDLLYVGKTRTLWVSRFGHGEEILLEDVRVKISDKMVELPPEFTAVWSEEVEKIRNDPRHFDGTQICLLNVHDYRSDEAERQVIVECGLNRYSTYQAVTVNIDGVKKKYKYLRDWVVTNAPIPFLSQGVGVHVAVVTEDSKLIFVKRAVRAGVGVRSGEVDLGAVEGLSKHLDLNMQEDMREANLESVIQRSVREELGILKEDIISYTLFGFGYDLQYTQWNFLAKVVLNIGSKELLNQRFPKYAKTKTEFDDVFAVDVDPDVILRTIESARIWSSAMALLDAILREQFSSAAAYERYMLNFRMKNEQQYSLKTVIR